MQPTYVIAWQSKSRGSVGRGKALFTREEAHQVAEELNRDHPTFHHEPLDLGAVPASVDTSSDATPVDNLPAISVVPLEKVIA